ncbi:hypothetical protein RZN05_11860 [Sphingomonas sp. HF-S4]|uniref:Uncharacterized protein n=1 Tax=Sphingomonas agrestis TaxID=3080540 RepID=A0ABU3Y8E9_9SPHN|nr:hypothetical protein [Sphingomonas sp. HF-S4]MDV3457683.1 hypothetical protein [Sphingomonas sp. HF-S4]
MASDGTPRPSDNQLFAKKASFIQHSLPGLEAGVYELSVQQQFFDSSGTPINSEELATLTRRFGVQGPRYSLPANVINAEYPPLGTAGGYSSSIAHVVLNQEKLPWIRTPYLPGGEPEVEIRHYTATYGGTAHPITYDDDKASWLAVILITTGDLDGADPATLITAGTAADLAPDTMQMQGPGTTTVAGKLPADHYSIFSYMLEPGLAPKDGIIDPGVGYTSDEPCSFADIPAALFNRIAPSLDDLQMMAHVRAVEMDSKPIQDNDSVSATESYGIVVGNRLPQTTPPTQVPPAAQTGPAVGRNLALLVSLESMQNALRGYPATGYYAKSVVPAPSGTVRLPVLYQWDFTSWQDTSFDFEHILKGLNGRDASAPNSGPKVPNPLMRRPDPPAYATPNDLQTIAQQMLELGYTPMNQLTRVPDTADTDDQAIQLVSWYRGPLAPFAVANTLEFLTGSVSAPQDQTELIYSADQLLRFDPNVGMYDVSYAAAWQIGRLVALQDKSFSLALYRWKKNADQKYRMMLEDQVLQQDFSAVMALYRSNLTAGAKDVADKPMLKAVMNLLTKSNRD